MPVIKENMLSAFDGIFTKGQQQDIINMSLIASQLGTPLHEIMKVAPPLISNAKIQVKNNLSYMPKKRCPECGKLMRLYPVNSDPTGKDRVGSTVYEKSDASEYKSMWLCGKSCDGSGCWHEEYNKFTVEEFKNGGIK